MASYIWGDNSTVLDTRVCRACQGSKTIGMCSYPTFVHICMGHAVRPTLLSPSLPPPPPAPPPPAPPAIGY